MTALASSTVQPTDADLITASRSGDRQAFGQIIRKYQAMVSGLVYAACGDLHRSEDVAQETFISAWKSLSGLRDASRLPGWLCQIARRRLADSARKVPDKEIQFSQAFAPGQEPTVPAREEPLNAEESELLWRTLGRIPQPYRETLVLYYRQEQSTAQVAAAMNSSEASVRQRLTRGRQMLRDEVATLLERNIARTSPNPQFTMRVVAALPALGAQTAGLTATAKASAAAKGGGLLGFLLAWVVPVSVLANMIFGTVKDLQDARSPRHRRIVKQTWFTVWAVLIVWVVSINWIVKVGLHESWSLSTLTWIDAAGGALFGIAFSTAGTIGKWRTDKLLAAEGLSEVPFPKLSFIVRLFAAAPVVFICIEWMIQLAIKAGDHLAVEVMCLAGVAISAYLADRLPKTQPDRAILHMFETFTLCLALIVIMINWRLGLWLAPANSDDIPFWGINLCAGIMFVWIAVLTLLSGHVPPGLRAAPKLETNPAGQ
jgi:RNA polymerase sigma factor (sigma-70 family)